MPAGFVPDEAAPQAAATGPAPTAAPPGQTAQQSPARLAAPFIDTSGMTLGDVYQLQQRMDRPITASGGSFGTQQVRQAPIDPTTLMSIPTLTSPIAEAAAAERFWPAIGRLATRFGINAAGTYGGTYGANRLADYLPESWRPWVDEAGGLIGGMGAALGGGKLFPEPALPTLTPKETAAIGDVTKAPMEPPRLGPITEEAAAEQQREAEAATRAKSYRPGKPLGTIEPTEVERRPSPSRESIFPGGEYRGAPASAQYPTTVPLTPLAVPKGGVGAYPQPPPPEETPVTPPRPFPSREKMFPGGYTGRPASAGYPTTDVSTTQTPRGGGGGGAGGGMPRGSPSPFGRVGSAGDIASWTPEQKWNQYMPLYMKEQAGTLTAEEKALKDALANDLARTGQAKASPSQVRSDVALPGVPGYERAAPGATPKIEPQRTPPAAQPAPPAAADPVEKFLRGEDLSAEEQLTVSNQLVAEVGPQQARQMMGEYTRGIKRMGGAKVK